MKQIAFLLSISLLTIIACRKNMVSEEFASEQKFGHDYKPEVELTNFTNSTIITNPLYPIGAGKKYIFEGQTPDGLEHIEEQRLNTTKLILGITCIVVNFKAYVDGILIEEAQDWYAQDNSGNLWYFGEAVDNYDADGVLLDHAGSWEAGKHNAKPGIIMLADPQQGDAYREEYYFRHAEDEAEVLETGITVTTPLGTFNNCIKTRNWTRLEPDLNEHKIFAPGYGLIKEINITDNTEIFLIAVQ